MTATEDASARPFWMTEPCPAWCSETHRDQDAPEDRRHSSREADLPLALEPADDAFGGGTLPSMLSAFLEQQVREVEPRLVLHPYGVFDHSAEALDFTMSLTLAEAERHAHAVLQLVAQARQATGDVHRLSPIERRVLAEHRTELAQEHTGPLQSPEPTGG